MPETDLELVRETFAQFQAGDPRWLEQIDPEIEWDFSAFPFCRHPDRGRGRQAVLDEVIATYMSGWRDLRRVAGRRLGSGSRRQRGERQADPQHQHHGAGYHPA